MTKTTHWALIALTALSISACSKKDTPGGEPEPTKVETVNWTITDLKAKSTAESVTIGEEGKIFKVKGIVISDNGATGKNLDSKTAVLSQEDGKAGIVVNFAAEHKFAAGTEVEIGVSKQKLAKIAGEIVLDAVPLDSAKSVATGKTAAVTEITAKELTPEKAAQLNGTLVKLPAGTFSGSGNNFTGTLQYNDGTASVSSLVATSAAFANTAYPALVSNLTGIVRIQATQVQVNLRTVADAVAKEGYIMVEDFSGADVGYYRNYGNGDIHPLYSNNFPNVLLTKFGEEHPNFALAGQIFGFGLSAFSIVHYGPIASGGPDANFTDAGRNYLQVTPMIRTANQTVEDSRGFGLGFHFLESRFLKAKSVTVVFAASKDKPAFSELISGGMVNSITWNDTYTTSYKAELSLGTPGTSVGYEILGESPVFTDQGVWHTVKFDNLQEIYATKKENIQDLSNYRTLANLYITPGAPSMGAEGLKGFDRGNLEATSTQPSNPNYKPTPFKVGVPIIIDKIIVEFDEKPSWW